MTRAGFVPLSRIRKDADTQMRVGGLDPEFVKAYRAYHLEGGHLGSWKVVKAFEREDYYLYDGFHREFVTSEIVNAGPEFEARYGEVPEGLREKLSRVPCEIVDCPQGQCPKLYAQRLAFTANSLGVPLTNADKGMIALRAILHPDTNGYTNGQVARMSGCTVATVENIRKELCGTATPSVPREALVRKYWADHGITPAGPVLAELERRNSEGRRKATKAEPKPAPVEEDETEELPLRDELPPREEVPPSVRDVMFDERLPRLIATLKNWDGLIDPEMVERALKAVKAGHHWLWRKYDASGDDVLSPASRAIKNLREVAYMLEEAISALEAATPVKVCHVCEGKDPVGVGPCPLCEGSGCLPRHMVADRA